MHKLNLPAVDKIAAIVERLGCTVVPTRVTQSNYAETLAIIRQLVGGTVLIKQRREIEQWYCRARKDVENPSDINQYSVPPASVTGFGRCNLPGYPVFYVSEDQGIAMQEIDLAAGELAYVAFWRSQKYFPTYAMYGFTSNVETTRLKHHANKRVANLCEYYGVDDPETHGSLVEIIKGYAELFTSDGWGVSSALSHHAIYEERCDGVEYPDAIQRSVYNFALNPSFAKKLELHRVWKCKISDDASKIEYLQIGTPCGDIVNWRSIRSDSESPRHDTEIPSSNIQAGGWEPSE